MLRGILVFLCSNLLYYIIGYLKYLDKQALLLPNEILPANHGHATERLISDCPKTSNLVGFKKVDETKYSFINPFIMNLNDLRINHLEKPSCSKTKTAIIIPYRDRLEQLSVFLQHMVPIFERKNMDYKIFVIEQDMKTPFNRGLLLNIGYTEAKKISNFTCYVFSDVDFLLQNDKVSYSCIDSPMHLMARADSNEFSLRYLNYVGGVCSIWGHHFEEVNGYSNNFWGWGSEDDDFSLRLRRKNMEIKRQDFKIISYHPNRISHKRRDFNTFFDRATKMFQKLRGAELDGLNNLIYPIKEQYNYPLLHFTKVDASIMYQRSVNSKNN